MKRKKSECLSQNHIPKNIVIGLGMRIKSRTAECMHVETDKKNKPNKTKLCGQYVSKSKNFTEAASIKWHRKISFYEQKI